MNNFSRFKKNILQQLFKFFYFFLFLFFLFSFISKPFSNLLPKNLNSFKILNSTTQYKNPNAEACMLKHVTTL